MMQVQQHSTTQYSITYTRVHPIFSSDLQKITQSDIKVPSFDSILYVNDNYFQTRLPPTVLGFLVLYTYTYVWLLKICLLLQGLRHSVFLGSLGTCLGSWIKVFATNQAHFPIMFAGQTVVAISQIFILGKVFEIMNCEQFRIIVQICRYGP